MKGLSTKKALLLLVGVLILAGGVFGTLKQVRKEIRRTRRQIQLILNGLAAIVDTNTVQALTGTTQDQQRTTYKTIHDFFNRAQQSIPDCDDIYLLMELDGQYSFGCGSLPPGDDEYIQPGLCYEEIDAETRAFFQSERESLVYGPALDRWGYYVTGYKRLPYNTQAGHQVVLGIDISARHWNLRILKHSLYPLLSAILLDILLALLCYYIQRMQKAEAMLRQTKEAAETANIAKMQLMSVMSTELRSPLLPIIRSSNNLQNSPTLDPSAHGMIKDIKRSTEMLIGVVDQLLMLGAMDLDKLEPNPVPIQLGRLETITYTQARSALDGKALDFTCSIDGVRAGTLLIDMEIHKQIMQQLLSNAAKFTEAGGRIAVRYEMLYGKNNRGRLRIAVQDTGCGVDAGKEELIFEAFRQADLSHTRKYGGVGIGLAIVRNILDRLNGKIWHEPVAEGGSCFMVEFPVWCDDLSANSQQKEGFI